MKEVQLFDAYRNTNDYIFEYLPGKGEGTYPDRVTVAENVYNADNELLFTAGTNMIDYTRVPDVNGYKGVVQAGDPVMKQQQSEASGYPWSKPVQITHESGANYSDISFVVNEDQDIQAIYVKYSQVLNGDGIFVEDTANRIFSYTIFKPVSTLEAKDIVLSDELPKSGERLDFGATVANTGLKPLENLTYTAYMKQDGVETALGEERAIVNLLNAFEGETVSDQPGSANRILGGHTADLFGSVDLPQDITNLTVGFRVIDEAGREILQHETPVEAMADLEIIVLGASIKAQNKADLSLYISNHGNIDYNGMLDIENQADGAALKSVSLDLAAGGKISLLEELDIDESMFGPVVTADDGSHYDQISVAITA